MNATKHTSQQGKWKNVILLIRSCLIIVYGETLLTAKNTIIERHIKRVVIFTIDKTLQNTATCLGYKKSALLVNEH